MSSGLRWVVKVELTSASFAFGPAQLNPGAVSDTARLAWSGLGFVLVCPFAALAVGVELLSKETTLYPRRVRMPEYKDSPNAAAMLLAEIEDGDADDAMGETDCPDGCYVEPDGQCSHGYRSAALTLGVI
jgi:hypothetical protein